MSKRTVLGIVGLLVLFLASPFGGVPTTCRLEGGKLVDAGARVAQAQGMTFVSPLAPEVPEFAVLYGAKIARLGPATYFIVDTRCEKHIYRWEVLFPGSSSYTTYSRGRGKCAQEVVFAQVGQYGVRIVDEDLALTTGTAVQVSAGAIVVLKTAEGYRLDPCAAVGDEDLWFTSKKDQTVTTVWSQPACEVHAVPTTLGGGEYEVSILKNDEAGGYIEYFASQLHRQSWLVFLPGVWHRR